MSDVELTEVEREALIVKVATTIHTNESHPDYPEYDEVPCSGQTEAHCNMGHEHGSRGVCWCCEPGAAAVVDDVLAPWLAARLSQEREQVRAEGAAIVESFRRQNPMNGDGSNYTIDLILATFVGPQECDRLKREHQDKWNAEYLAMCDRFAAEDGPRPAVKVTHASAYDTPAAHPGIREDCKVCPPYEIPADGPRLAQEGEQ